MHDAASAWNAGFIRQVCNRRVLLPDKSGVPAVGSRDAPPEDALSRRGFMVNVKPEMTGTATTESIRNPQSAIRQLPELLAPAGDWDCARAAVENGADAIYFGLEKFNARMRADNFTGADLPRLMEFLHRRGVRAT